MIERIVAVCTDRSLTTPFLFCCRFGLISLSLTCLVSYYLQLVPKSNSIAIFVTVLKKKFREFVVAWWKNTIENGKIRCSNGTFIAINRCAVCKCGHNVSRTA